MDEPTPISFQLNCCNNPPVISVRSAAQGSLDLSAPPYDHRTADPWRQSYFARRQTEGRLLAQEYGSLEFLFLGSDL